VIISPKRKIEWVRIVDSLAVLTLFFCSILFFYDLYHGRYLLTERDLGFYSIPPRFFLVESIKNGDFPLWNPYQFSGHPFFANLQNAILYPLNSLFYILPFDVAFNAIIILHFFLGGLFTYLLLRDLGVNPSGSLISGLIFMLGGHLLAVHSLLPTLLSVIWIPMIVLFFRRAINRPGLKNEILTALFMTFSFLGGGVEHVYGHFIVLLFMAIFSSPMKKENQPFDLLKANPSTKSITNSHGVQWFSSISFFGRRLIQKIAYKAILINLRSLFLVTILFLILSSIQLIPFFELLQNSIRGLGISYKEATIWSFSPKDILLFFLPDAYGYFADIKKYWSTQCWLKTYYTGGLPLILASIYFIFGKDRILYLAWIFLSLFLALGSHNPLYPFVYKYVPFFGGMRYPVKFLYIFILVLSITAGLGFQRFVGISKEGGGKRLKNVLMVSSLISGIFLLCLILNHRGVESFLKLKGFDFPDFNYLSINLYHFKRFLLYLTIFFLLLRVGYELRWKVWVKLLIIFFLTADLFGNMGFYGKERTSDYFRKTRILEIISSDKEPFRVFSTGKTISLDTPILIAGGTSVDILKEKNLPPLSFLFRLHNIWGIDVIRLKRTDDLYRAFTGAPSISSNNVVDLYSIKYIISVTPIEKDSRFELIYSRLEGLRGKREDLLKENTIKLYRNRNPLPRAWLVKDFRVLDSKDILSTVITKEFRPEREVLLEEEPLWINPKSSPSQQAGKISMSWSKASAEDRRNPKSIRSLQNEVEILSETNNRLKLLVKASEKTFLVLSDTFFPGWKVYVDGNRRKIFRANYAFRSLPLEDGKHHVEFVYDPLSFKIGALISAFGLALAAFLWIKYN
jgi:hypothetical protein